MRQQERVAGAAAAAAADVGCAGAAAGASRGRCRRRWRVGTGGRGARRREQQRAHVTNEAVDHRLRACGQRGAAMHGSVANGMVAHWPVSLQLRDGRRSTLENEHQSTRAFVQWVRARACSADARHLCTGAVLAEAEGEHGGVRRSGARARHASRRARIAACVESGTRGWARVRTEGSRRRALVCKHA